MKNRILKIIPIIIVLAWMGVIFYFSHQNGNSSSKMSNGVTRWVVNTFIPNFSSLTKTEQTEVLKNTSFIIRKLAHYGEYAILGFFLFSAVYVFTDKEKILFPVASLLGILYAISDEFHQSFISGRAPSAKDVVIDSVGVLTAIFILGIFLSIKKIRKKKRKVV